MRHFSRNLWFSHKKRCHGLGWMWLWKRSIVVVICAEPETCVVVVNELSYIFSHQIQTAGQNLMTSGSSRWLLVFWFVQCVPGGVLRDAGTCRAEPGYPYIMPRVAAISQSNTCTAETLHYIPIDRIKYRTLRFLSMFHGFHSRRKLRRLNIWRR